MMIPSIEYFKNNAPFWGMRLIALCIQIVLLNARMMEWCCCDDYTEMRAAVRWFKLLIKHVISIDLDTTVGTNGMSK